MQFFKLDDHLSNCSVHEKKTFHQEAESPNLKSEELTGIEWILLGFYPTIKANNINSGNPKC